MSAGGTHTAFSLTPATKPLAIAGIALGAAAAGIKYPERPDLMVMSIPQRARVAAVFTRNVFCAAPVTVAREHLATGTPRYLVVNSGNANAGTGARGRDHAVQICRELSRLGGCSEREVLPFSTGVIGEPLPVERMVAALPCAHASLSADGWDAAVRAMMTTDTFPKWSSVTVQVEDTSYTVTGIAKGAGMIKPDMATLLAFVATDAAVGQRALRRMLTGVTARTFNRITVDGDTSTNDACVFVASGARGGAARPTPAPAHWPAVAAGFEHVCADLARAIIRDGEGATKFVTVEVTGGRTEHDCAVVAYAIAESPLVKTALFASDPNWGRILAAAGRSKARGLVPGQVSIFINDYCIVAHGERAPGYVEQRAAERMAAADITIRIEIGGGETCARVWTCDLSYDYVRINAEYRS